MTSPYTIVLNSSLDFLFDQQLHKTVNRTTASALQPEPLIQPYNSAPQCGSLL